MPALREVLDRFRAAGPPGPAAPAAVPADRRSALLDEVAPVFATLAPVVDQARQLLAAAAQEAERIRADADREAELIVHKAEEGREEVYAATFAEARAAAAQRADTRTAQAYRTAEEIAERARARCPDLAERAAGYAHRALAPPDRIAVP